MTSWHKDDMVPSMCDRCLVMPISCYSDAAELTKPASEAVLQEHVAILTVHGMTMTKALRGARATSKHRTVLHITM